MHHRPPLLPLLPALALLMATLPVHAQRAGLTVPAQLPLQPVMSTAMDHKIRALPDALPLPATLARKRELQDHVRRHRDVLDTDAAGAPVIRSEVVAIEPTTEALDRARAAGFTVAGDRTLEELDLRIVVLRARRGAGTRAALRTLRKLDPAGQYDFNHLYRSSGSASADTVATAQLPVSRRPAAPLRVGLIDSGVSREHPALAGVDVRNWGCDGRLVPDAHGTAVGSLLVGAAGGATERGTTLFAADIYCGQPTGGAVTRYVEAMAWLARERVGVINLSLVGPHNALLQRATQSLAARGHVLVAAVGNDGPAAAPLFPAAYPDVIGVTAVDHRKRALPEAGRGPHVDFAAPGSDLRAARPGGDWGPVRGTSYAAPLVARVAALYAPEPGAGRIAEVRARLTDAALDLGRTGRDEIYGDGLVGGGLAQPAVGDP